MVITKKSIIDAFNLLFESMIRQDFSKTHQLQRWNERDLLLPIRTFILGYFRTCQPEAMTNLPHRVTGKGRIDFKISNVAVEFAICQPDASNTKLSPKSNKDEVKKLLKYNGKSLLMLFDFSKWRYTKDELNDYRIHPSFGKGKHHKSPFSVAYFYLAELRPKKPGLIRLNVQKNSA